MTFEARDSVFMSVGDSGESADCSRVLVGDPHKGCDRVGDPVHFFGNAIQFFREFAQLPVVRFDCLEQKLHPFFEAHDSILERNVTG